MSQRNETEGFSEFLAFIQTPKDGLFTLIENTENLFIEMGNAISANEIAERISFSVPENWYKLARDIAISRGDILNACFCMVNLKTGIKVKQKNALIENIILSGNLKNLEHSQKIFKNKHPICIWQNTLIIKTVRLMWWIKYKNESPSTDIKNFKRIFTPIVSGFELRELSIYNFLGLGEFSLYDKTSMKYIYNLLTKIGVDSETRIFSEGIMKASPENL
jgi:hypothetical protein